MTAAGDEIRTIEDFDSENQRLQRKRERLAWLRADPEHRQAREARRIEVLGALTPFLSGSIASAAKGVSPNRCHPCPNSLRPTRPTSWRNWGSRS